jgi:hypothetical protein
VEICCSRAPPPDDGHRGAGPPLPTSRRHAGSRIAARERIASATVFRRQDGAASLKRSAERSSRRKTGAYRSALAMLTFYIDRAGKTLPKTRRERLERAKVELKRAFEKD